MRILILDLNYPDLIEDYGRINPNKYGGSGAVYRHLMPYLNNNNHYCEIWADQKCFENVEEKYKRFCKPLDHGSKEKLRHGHFLKNYATDFDIVLHNFYAHKVNCEGTKTKDVVWLVGYGEYVNPLNERIIIYNDYQGVKIRNPNTKVYKARIGVPMPTFEEHEKEDFIFSCHRQSKDFGSETMMQLAHRYKFRYITAGPKDNNFPNIMDYVDNKYVTYLGLVDTKTKVDLFKRAYCSTYLHNWQTPMNLSALESLSYGTPIIATRIGFWPSLIKNHENGFLISTEQDFCIALSNIPLISQKSCYNSIQSLSSDLMVQDYLNVFKKILEE